MRWTMDSNSVNPIEFYNINVTLISELDHPAKPRWPLDENALFLKGAGVKL